MKSELAFALFRSEALDGVDTRLFNVHHFVTVGIVYNFSNFFGKQKYSEQNKYTTFINSSWGISEQKMREINFSSRCHIFVISRGLRGHSLLTPAAR